MTWFPVLPETKQSHTLRQTNVRYRLSKNDLRHSASDMQILQERQRLIDAELVQAMIESTPESWVQIVLTLTRSRPTDLPVDAARPGQLGGLFLELSSPEGYPPVGGTDSLSQAVCKLDDMLRGAHGLLVKAVYVATQENGEWKYHAEYEYGKL
jgi:hypothetical protein